MARRSGRRPAGAGIAAAAVSLLVAGCSQALPLGGQAPAAQHHLASAIVLQIVTAQAASPAGNCPAGSAKLPPPAQEFPGSGQCYRRLGEPLTITSAAVRYLQQPASYGLAITVPAKQRPALTAITTTAYNDRDQLATTVAGKTWNLATVDSPFTGQFEIPAQSTNQALQLHRTLIPSS